MTTEFKDLNLHSACATGNLGLAQFALSQGQPVDSLLNGVYPIHTAATGGNVLVLKLLISHGADVNTVRQNRAHSTKVPPIGTVGSTPLHFAAANGHGPAVRYLLEHGAHPSLPDKYGVTPESLARENDHFEVAQILRAARSDSPTLAAAHERHMRFIHACKTPLIRHKKSVDAMMKRSHRRAPSGSSAEARSPQSTRSTHSGHSPHQPSHYARSPPLSASSSTFARSELASVAEGAGTGGGDGGGETLAPTAETGTASVPMAAREGLRVSVASSASGPASPAESTSPGGPLSARITTRTRGLSFTSYDDDDRASTASTTSRVSSLLQIGRARAQSSLLRLRNKSTTKGYNNGSPAFSGGEQLPDLSAEDDLIGPIDGLSLDDIEKEQFDDEHSKLSATQRHRALSTLSERRQALVSQWVEENYSSPRKSDPTGSAKSTGSAGDTTDMLKRQMEAARRRAPSEARGEARILRAPSESASEQVSERTPERRSHRFQNPTPERSDSASTGSSEPMITTEHTRQV